MADNKVKTDNGQAKKEPWTTKRVITTIIIVALALLMLGGSYYIIVMIQQNNNESNVFGYYDGEPVKYEAGSVFATTLSQSDYDTAIANGDLNSLWSIWYSAYQNEIIYMAMDKAAKEAGVVTVPELVNRLIISSGTYSDDDGNFSEEIYNNTSLSQRSSYYSYIEKIFGYQTVMQDIYGVKVSNKELDMISNLAENSRNFEYFVIDYNVYPDDLAAQYDISGMTDNAEPTMSEIKAYIFANNPELVTPYIDEAAAAASALADTDFYAAADEYGIVSVANASNNIGGSNFVIGIEYADLEKGLLNKAAKSDEELSRTLFTAAEGYVTEPVSVDGSYIIIRVGSDAADESISYYVTQLYKAYAGQSAVVDYSSAVLDSDKLEDKFTERFLSIFLASSV